MSNVIEKIGKFFGVLAVLSISTNVFDMTAASAADDKPLYGKITGVDDWHTKFMTKNGRPWTCSIIHEIDDNTTIIFTASNTANVVGLSVIDPNIESALDSQNLWEPGARIKTQIKAGTYLDKAVSYPAGKNYIITEIDPDNVPHFLNARNMEILYGGIVYRNYSLGNNMTAVFGALVECATRHHVTIGEHVND